MGGRKEKKRFYRQGQLQYNLEKIWVMKTTSGLSTVCGTIDLIPEAGQQHNKNQSINTITRADILQKKKH